MVPGATPSPAAALPTEGTVGVGEPVALTKKVVWLAAPSVSMLYAVAAAEPNLMVSVPVRRRKPRSVGAPVAEFLKVMTFAVGPLPIEAR